MQRGACAGLTYWQGFNVELGRYALGQEGFVSDTAENRASDIHEMFARQEVAAIIAAIGGDHSCHLLPHLDFDLIRAHPKIFMGYSDISVLNVAIWKECGLVTFNGPTLITDFAEFPQPLAYTVDAFKRTVEGVEPVGEIYAASHWTDETLDWAQQLDLTRARTLEESAGWTWLRAGACEGTLVGGCIESLQHLRGTRFWPDRPDWKGAILFLEASEEAPSPERVDGILMDYENMGVFAELAGLLFGRPMRYTHSERERLREVILDRTASYSFPVVSDMDFGHTSPQFTLPIGCRARIDSDKQIFSIVESAVC